MPTRFFRSRTARQSLGFAGSAVVTNLLAVVSTAILTRHLETDEFGSYAFANSLLLLVALFFEFGLFVPAARLAAMSDPPLKREVVGAALAVYVPVAIAFAVTILGLSFFIDDWFHVEASSALQAAAPFVVAVPFGYVLQQIAQGVDRLHIASIAAVVAQLLLVALLAAWVGGGGGLTTATALVVRSISFLVAGIAAVFWLRPLFSHTVRWVRELIRQAWEWGFHQTIGRLLSIGTYNMDVLMLGIWATPRWVGLYFLAGSIAYATGLPVVGFSAALFPRMAREAAIRRRTLLVAAAIGAVCSVMAALLAEPAIRIFFSGSYVDAASLVPALVLAQFVRGITTIFNTFLSAHGKGVALRNAGLILTGSNVVFNFTLIPPFGAQGAAWASVLALVLNLAAHIWFYKRLYPL